jgi:hypothetical protein
MMTVLEDISTDLESDRKKKLAHLVLHEYDIVEAMINKTPVTAVCGYTYIPSGFFQGEGTGFEKCPACVELEGFTADLFGG